MAMGAFPLRAANSTELTSSVIIARMVANTCRSKHNDFYQGKLPDGVISITNV
jgi:hypothetical protein